MGEFFKFDSVEFYGLMYYEMVGVYFFNCFNVDCVCVIVCWFDEIC